MGTFNKKFLEFSNYKLDVFIETGTNQGASLYEAMHYTFREIISIEICPTLFAEARKKFDDPRLSLHCGSSPVVLNKILPCLLDEHLTFWLDAHDSGGQYREHDALFGQCPLLEELKAITRNSLMWRPVIIIDDVHMFQDEYWRSGVGREQFDRKQWPTLKEIELALHGFRFAIDKEQLYCY